MYLYIPYQPPYHYALNESPFLLVARRTRRRGQKQTVWKIDCDCSLPLIFHCPNLLYKKNPIGHVWTVNSPVIIGL